MDRVNRTATNPASVVVPENRGWYYVLPHC
jgi:hypothetical protein